VARTKTASTKTTGTPARATLQTVADRVGVSRTTVSNAYSRPDQLTPELREKILAAAKELGYAGPNPAARTLRRGTSRTVGVLYTEALTFAFTDPAAVALLRGISEVSAPRGYSMQLIPSPPGSADSIDAVRDAVVDGFIVYCMPHGDPRHDALVERGMPVVMVDERPGATDAFVGIDDRGGARAVAQHLIDLGHRRFGVIVDRLLDDNATGPADLARQAAATFDVNAERLRGYADAMEPAGIDWADVPVMECHPLSPEAGAACAASLLDRPDRPTAILCGADQLALGVLDAARARGIDVPGELSVAGFDDIEAAARSNPPLTTVRQPLLEKGRAAARQLFADWGDGPPEHVILPVELIVRGSTAPAPGR
jgi:DNA-binding LacI/PurR family transcriptional regulator